MLLHGLTATRRYVVMGSRAAAALRASRARLRRPRPRRAPRPAADGDYGYEHLAGDLGAVLDARRRRAGGAGGRLDGRPHGGPLRARAARAGRRAGADHARRSTPAIARSAARSSRAGTRSRAGCARGAWRASSRPTTWTACPSAGGRRSRPCCASGSPPTSTRQAVADALEVVPRSRPFEDPAGAGGARGRRRWSSPAATRPTPGTRWRSGSAGRSAIPGARLVVEDPGALADRLAGRAALAADRASLHSRRTYVITYARMPVRDWDGSSYDRISGAMEALGLEVLDAAGAGGRRDRARRGLRLRPGHRSAARAPAARPRDRRRRVGVDDRGRARAARRRAPELRVCDLLELELERAGRRDPLDRHLPLDRRPRAAVRAPARVPAQPAAGWWRSAGERATSSSCAAARCCVGRARALRRALRAASARRGTTPAPRRRASACWRPASRARECWLTPAPQQPEEPREFLETIVLQPHVQRSRRSCGSPSWTRCWPSWASRWSSTTCG